MSDPTITAGPEHSMASEFKAFLFATIFLAPIVSVALVGSYGFIIWISQILAGPPVS